jgi:hypothetical protein
MLLAIQFSISLSVSLLKGSSSDLLKIKEFNPINKMMEAAAAIGINLEILFFKEITGASLFTGDTFA